MNRLLLAICFLTFFVLVFTQQPPKFNNFYEWKFTGSVSSDVTDKRNWQCLAYSDPSDPWCQKHPHPGAFASIKDLAIIPPCSETINPPIFLSAKVIEWPTLSMNGLSCPFVLQDSSTLIVYVPHFGIIIPDGTRIMTNYTFGMTIHTLDLSQVGGIAPQLYANIIVIGNYVAIRDTSSLGPEYNLLNTPGSGSWHSIVTTGNQITGHITVFRQSNSDFGWHGNTTKRDFPPWTVQCFDSVMQFFIYDWVEIFEGPWIIPECSLVGAAHQIDSSAQIKIHPDGSLNLEGTWVFNAGSQVFGGGSIVIPSPDPKVTSFLGTINDTTIRFTSSLSRARVDGVFNGVNIVASGELILERTISTQPLQLENVYLGPNGVITFSGGSFQVNGNLSGEVRLFSATLTVAGSTDNVVRIYLDPTSVLIFSSNSITSLPAVVGFGNIIFNGGTYRITDSTVLNALWFSIDNGVVSWERTVNTNLFSPLIINSGQFVNRGIVTLSSSDLLVNGPNGQFVNSGTMTVNGTITSPILNGGQFVNDGGILNVNAPFTLGTQGSGTSTFLNTNGGTVNVIRAATFVADLVRQSASSSVSRMFLNGQLFATSLNNEERNELSLNYVMNLTTSLINAGTMYVGNKDSINLWPLQTGNLELLSNGLVDIEIAYIGFDTNDVATDVISVWNGDVILNGTVAIRYWGNDYEWLPQNFWFPFLRYSGVRRGEFSAMSNDSVSGVICYDDAQKRVLFIAQLSVYNPSMSFEPVPEACRSLISPPPTSPPPQEQTPPPSSPPPPPPQEQTPPPSSPTPPPLAPQTPPSRLPPAARVPPVPPRAPGRKKSDGFSVGPSSQLCTFLVLASVTLALFDRHRHV